MFLIIFIIVLYILNDAFSLLMYGILMVYVFLNYDTFFTDTMSASLVGTLQLITGVIAAGSWYKMVVVLESRYKKEMVE